MSDRHQEEQQELMVFAEFAKVCPLRLLPDSAQKRQPPEPDILCDLELSEMLAFELVSAEDVTREDAHPESVPWTKKLNDSMKLQNSLYREYREALAAGHINQPERFKFHTFYVEFEGDANCRQRMRAMPRVIELLNQHDPESNSITEWPIRSIWCRPWPQLNGLDEGPDGPSFYVGSPCGARPYITERIKEKLTKNYDSKNKIHLLAWSTTATASEFYGLGRDKQLANLLQSNGMGQFDRIWVFGLHEKSIVFDSADWANREKPIFPTDEPEGGRGSLFSHPDATAT